MPAAGRGHFADHVGDQAIEQVHALPLSPDFMNTSSIKEQRQETG